MTENGYSDIRVVRIWVGAGQKDVESMSMEVFTGNASQDVKKLEELASGARAFCTHCIQGWSGIDSGLGGRVAEFQALLDATGAHVRQEAGQPANDTPKPEVAPQSANGACKDVLSYTVFDNSDITCPFCAKKGATVWIQPRPRKEPIMVTDVDGKRVEVRNYHKCPSCKAFVNFSDLHREANGKK